MLDAAIQRCISVAESLDQWCFAFIVGTTFQHPVASYPYLLLPVYVALFFTLLSLVFNSPWLTSILAAFTVKLAGSFYLELRSLVSQPPLQVSEPQVCPSPPTRTSDTEVEPLPEYDQLEPGPPGYMELFYLDRDAELWPLVWGARRRYKNAQYGNIYYERWEF